MGMIGKFQRNKKVALRWPADIPNEAHEPDTHCAPVIKKPFLYAIKITIAPAISFVASLCVLRTQPTVRRKSKSVLHQISLLYINLSEHS